MKNCFTSTAELFSVTKDKVTMNNLENSQSKKEETLVEVGFTCDCQLHDLKDSKKRT